MKRIPISFHLRPLSAVSSIATTVAALVLLCAVGASAQSPFALSVTSPVTIQTQHHANLTVTVTPVSSYSGSVLVYCANLPIYVTCTFIPYLDQYVNVSGTPVGQTFVLNTSAVNQYETRLRQSPSRAVTMCALLGSGVFVFFFGRRRKGYPALLLAALMLTGVASLSGCSSTTPASTPAGTYTIYMNGTDSYSSTSTSFQLIVTN